MSTIALELIAAMIKAGDIGPIHRGEFRKEHCTDAGSETLFEFLSQYRQISKGQGHVPAMSVLRDRFPHISLPETAEILDIGGLVHEARVYKTKLRIQTLTDKLVGAIEAIDPITELRNVRMEFDEIMKDASQARDLSFDDCALEILDDYQAKMILKQGIPWPWPSLQYHTQGLHPGEFYIIAGRPKSRKTFVALYIAAYLVKAWRMRVLFVSPEMMPRQVMLRFMAFVAEVHYAEFKKGELEPYEEEMLFETIAMLHDAMTGLLSDDGTEYTETDPTASPRGQGAFIVTKATGQPVSFIEAKIKEHRPHIVIVDSFYRLGTAGGVKYDSDWKVLTTVSRLLKDIATEHEVPLIGTHQLNREADEKIGNLSNLGYSDAIGQDCDLAFRVITAKRKAGDQSALIMLGARETDCEGVFIHNEPCHDYREIEPILPGMKKKVLQMMADEEEAEKMAKAEDEQQALAGNRGGPPGLRSAAVKKAVQQGSAGIPMGPSPFDPPSPDDVRVDGPDEGR